MNFGKEQKAIIADALRMKARAIRSEVTATAKAIGKWDDPGVKRLIDEAHVVESLAERFAS